MPQPKLTIEELSDILLCLKQDNIRTGKERKPLMSKLMAEWRESMGIKEVKRCMDPFLLRLTNTI